MHIAIVCALAGAAGGFVKSLLEHRGMIILPDTAELEGKQVLILGTLSDVIGGGIVGVVLSHQMVYELFSSTEPNFALAFFLGLAWMPVIQAILNKFGLGNNSNPKKLQHDILPLICLTRGG